MAYIGAEPLPGQNREVDDISSSFNGSTTAFTLQVSGVNVSPESANNILVNLGGVIQNPGTDYTIAASTLTFTTAPASGLSFFALILGAGINTATVADQTIGTSKILDNAVTADKLAHTSVTAGSYTTADITVDAQGRITAAANGTIAEAEIANNAVTTNKIANDAVTFSKMQDTANGVRFLGKHDSGGGEIGEITAAQARTMINVADGANQTTINNNADNRVITGSGTANTLEAESSFTYDVSTNTALISSASSPRIKVTDTTNNCTTEILSVNSASQIGSISNHPLSIATNNVERIHIDTSGNVGIGSNAPESKLAIKGSSGQQDLFSISDTTVPTSGAEYGVMMIKTATTNRALNVTNYSTSGIGIRVYNNGGAVGRDALVCEQAGGTRLVVNEDVTVSTGNLVIGTAGKGIDFSAQTAAGSAYTKDSELLDHYEEGTFTPTVSSPQLNSMQNAAFTDASYAQRNGNYIKIGRLVMFVIEIQMASSTTLNGVDGTQVNGITGAFPFARATSSRPISSPCSIRFTGSTFGNHRIYADARNDFPPPYVRITESEGSGLGTLTINEAFPPSGHVFISGFYLADA